MKSTGGRTEPDIRTRNSRKAFLKWKRDQSEPDIENGLKVRSKKKKIMRERREVLTWEARRGKKMKLEQL